MNLVIANKLLQFLLKSRMFMKILLARIARWRFSLFWCLMFVLSDDCPVWWLSCLMFVLSDVCPVWCLSCLMIVLSDDCPVWWLSCLMLDLSDVCLMSDICLVRWLLCQIFVVSKVCLVCFSLSKITKISFFLSLSKTWY